MTNPMALILVATFMSKIIPSLSFVPPNTSLSHPDLHLRSQLRSLHKFKSPFTFLNANKVDIDIHTISIGTGNFAEEFINSGSWSKKPILMKNAFQLEADEIHGISDSDSGSGSESESESSCWPSWDEVMSLASDEDGEARIITHNPQDPHSWELGLGPIKHDFADGMEDDGLKWTVVVNDVDRFHPSLSDWIETTFSMVPQWRRDDGQISLSQEGGGIGPHVDDYDVFLIQMTGRRRWEVGKRPISSEEEVNGLIDGIDVRVLSFWDDEIREGLVESFTLDPGDVLYLPPRFGHCGTAMVDGSMTLSVGLRAPSAKDLMTKMMDHVSDRIDEPFVTRYTDPHLFENSIYGTRDNRDEISDEMKAVGKRLVKSAINRLLDDDIFFDELFGKLVTQSNRVRWDYPASLDSMDDESREELGVWSDAKASITGVANGEGILYPAEGIAWAYSIVETEDGKVFRLFIDGRTWEVALDTNEEGDTNFLKDMIRYRQVNSDLLQREGLSKQLYDLLEQLVHEGYLYAD